MGPSELLTLQPQVTKQPLKPGDRTAAQPGSWSRPAVIALNTRGSFQGGREHSMLQGHGVFRGVLFGQAPCQVSPRGGPLLSTFLAAGPKAWKARRRPGPWWGEARPAQDRLLLIWEVRQVRRQCPGPARPALPGKRGWPGGGLGRPAAGTGPRAAGASPWPG